MSKTYEFTDTAESKVEELAQEMGKSPQDIIAIAIELLVWVNDARKKGSRILRAIYNKDLRCEEFHELKKP